MRQKWRISAIAATTLASLSIPVLALAATAREQGLAPIVFMLDLDDKAIQGIVSKSSFASIVKEDGNKVLKLSTPPGTSRGNYRLHFPLPKNLVAGRTLLFSANVKANDVAKPAHSWNGLKFQLHFKYTSGADFWKNPPDIYGSFDWRRLTFSAAIPSDVENPELMLGFEDSNGNAWLSEIEVKILKERKTLAQRGKADYDTRVVEMPRLRGVMSPNDFKGNGNFKEGDIKELAKWKANGIRWQIVWDNKKDSPKDLNKYNEWLSQKLNELDKVLSCCNENGIKVVVDLHSAPGGKQSLFSDPRYQKRFIEIWREIALRYKDNPAIWGYDILNEPTLFDIPLEGVYDWIPLAKKTIEEIRKVDAETPVILETEEMASPELFSSLECFPERNVIYSFHFYVPHGFTHQLKRQGPYNTYPGMINGVEWNKERLCAAMKPVVDFQRETGARVYVGEFSAIRWAPGADRYISDCISLFEEYGWDWTYHAFREWDGWDVECGSAPSDVTRRETTDRKSVLLKAFEQNSASAAHHVNTLQDP